MIRLQYRTIAIDENLIYLAGDDLVKGHGLGHIWQQMKCKADLWDGYTIPWMCIFFDQYTECEQSFIKQRE